jgi:hypothetical protein
VVTGPKTKNDMSPPERYGNLRAPMSLRQWCGTPFLLWIPGHPTLSHCASLEGIQ